MSNHKIKIKNSLYGADEPVEQASIEWIEGRYRTSAGVVIGAQDGAGKVLNCQHIRDTAHPVGDTQGMWKSCWMGIDRSTRVVYSIAEAPPASSTPETAAGEVTGPEPTMQPLTAPEPESVDGTQIPQELKNKDQWLCWKYGERDGKPTKIPIDPETYKNTSGPDAAWTYEVCWKAMTGGFRGTVGLGVSLRNGFVGIDLDDVLDDAGNLKSENAGLEQIIDKISSYTELSPSRTGLHILFMCDEIPLECKSGPKRKGNVEMYCEGRFFTITGRAWKYPNKLRTLSGEEYREIHYLLFGCTMEPNRASGASTPAAGPDMTEEDAWDAILCGGDPLGAEKNAAGYGRSKYELQKPKTEVEVKEETNEKRSEKSSEPERRSLESFADWIGFNYKAWAIISEKKDNPYEIKPTDWRRMWHDQLHIAAIADGKRPGGALWFDGVEWQVDPQGVAIHTAMNTAIQRAKKEIRTVEGNEYEIKLTPALKDIQPIAALREANCAYNISKRASDAQDGLVFSDGVRVRIRPNGAIERSEVDPDKDIWFGTLPIRSDELWGDIEAFGDWEELAREKFPNWYAAVSKCGDGKTAFIASIAGAVVYSSCKDLPALDVLFWAFDAELGHTGKTRHLTLVRDAFGSIAGAGDWSDIIGKHSHTGDLQGKYMLFCDEAGDGMIKDTAFLKALVSGTATYRPLYRDPQTLTHPVIVMCAANHRPVISPAVAKDPVLRRFVCSEWTKQFSESSAFPCKKEEALTAIINVGYAVARKCILAVSGGKSAKEALPYQNDIAELKELVQFVPWIDELALITQRGGEVGLQKLRLALIHKLMEKGLIPDIPHDVLEKGQIPAEYLRSCPELRSNRAFRQELHGREISERFADAYSVLRENKYRVFVKDRHNASRKTGDGERFMVVGCTFRKTGEEEIGTS